MLVAVQLTHPQKLYDGDTDMNKINIQRAEKLAKDLEIKAEFILHEKTGKTTEDAEEALGVSPDNILKTLILYASKEKKYIGAIILGSDRLDMKKLAKISEVKKLRFANNDQIQKLTGFAIGGVPPTAIKFCSAMFIDNKVYEKKFVVGAGGDEFCGMKFAPKHFSERLNLKFVNIT